MKKRGYIFTNRKNPLTSVMSVILGCISIIGIVYGIVSSYVMEGEVPARYGFAGALILVYSVVGLVLALYTLKKEEAFHGLAIAGIILNGITILIEAFLLWIAG